MERLYFDYAATTPVRKEVIKAMMPFFDISFGNPGSLHSFGQVGMAAVDQAREVVAESLKTDFRNVIFCGSATEANNFAIRGVVNSWKKINAPRVIVSAIEHESILDTVKALEAEKKIDLVVLPVNGEGIVSTDALKESLNENTALVSIMYVNNETGVIQPIKEISEIIKKTYKHKNVQTYQPIFHSDCVQAFSYFDCSFEVFGADIITLSAHKCGGPKGIGILAFSRALTPNLQNLSPIITGGGQEFGLRSGTENVVGIVGCATALSFAHKNRAKEYRRIEKIKKEFIKKFLKLFPESFINGKYSAPHIVNMNISMNREEFLTQADLLGIAFSSGAACSARSHARSHVLSAMYGDDLKKQNGIRASFGYKTKEGDIGEAVKRLERVFKKKVK